MTRWLPVLALLMCGCGRVGFGALAAVDPDAPPSPDGPSDGPPPDSAREALMATAFAYWKFDDGGGTTALDATGNGHTLTLVNGPSWTAGRFDGAVSSDGIDDYLVSVAPLDLSSTAAITLSLWSNRPYTVGPNHTLVELSTDFNATTSGFGLFPDDDDASGCAPVGFYVGVVGDVGYTMNCYVQPTSDVWHHIVVIYDKSRTADAEVALFIDGVAQTPSSMPYVSNNTNAFAAHPLYVFSRNGTLEFNPGLIDEMSIFARALTPAERALL